MREKPILFGDELVRAIVAGQKTQTRRLMKQPPLSVEVEANPSVILKDGTQPASRNWYRFDTDTSARIEWLRPGSRDKPTPRRLEWAKRWHQEGWHKERGYARWDVDEVVGALCPFGAPGDHLWVRECFLQFAKKPEPGEGMPANAVIDYRASFSRAQLQPGFDSDGDPYPAPRWKPSIHMPRWASRLTLEVTGVRVERLHDISEADAEAEGFQPVTFSTDGRGTDVSATARERFLATWEAIYGAAAQASNPWVWVVSFRRMP